MTEFMHDPDSLADLLDSLLPADGSVPSVIPATDDPLIEAAARLATAPRPELKPEALARISAKMNEAQSLPKAASNSGLPLPLISGGLLILVIVVLALFGGIIAFVVLRGGSTNVPENTPVPTITETVSPTAIQTETATTTIQPTSTALPTATLQSTSTALPTVTPVLTATRTLSPTAMLVPTVTVQSVVIPEITAEITPELVELPITVVVEGPVEAITVNVIVIYGIEIMLAPDNPLLTVIQIGDILRVEGELIGGERLTMTFPVTVVVVNVEVYVNPDGQVWRDNAENCNNPPPAWAPANGWRARCEGGGQPEQGNSGRGGGNSGGQPQGQGGGQGMGDDDD